MSEQNDLKIKIVVDTNIWISFLIGKKITSLKNYIIDNNIDIYFSGELLEELADVFNRPYLRKYFSEQDITDLFILFENKIKKIKILNKITVCRDPKDNFLLELAATAGADYLVSGDSDLLDLKSFRNTKIISPLELEQILNKLNSNI